MKCRHMFDVITKLFDFIGRQIRQSAKVLCIHFKPVTDRCQYFQPLSTMLIRKKRTIHKKLSSKILLFVYLERNSDFTIITENDRHL